jgi:hypothetical protein
MSNSVPVAGEPCPRVHNRWPETVSSRMSNRAVQVHFQNTTCTASGGETPNVRLGYQAPGAAATLILAPYDQYEVGTP